MELHRQEYVLNVIQLSETIFSDQQISVLHVVCSSQHFLDAHPGRLSKVFETEQGFLNAFSGPSRIQSKILIHRDFVGCFFFDVGQTGEGLECFKQIISNIQMMLGGGIMQKIKRRLEVSSGCSDIRHVLSIT